MMCLKFLILFATAGMAAQNTTAALRDAPHASAFRLVDTKTTPPAVRKPLKNHTAYPPAPLRIERQTHRLANLTSMAQRTSASLNPQDSTPPTPNDSASLNPQGSTPPTPNDVTSPKSNNSSILKPHDSPKSNGSGTLTPQHTALDAQAQYRLVHENASIPSTSASTALPYPIAADGKPQDVPARVALRCRYAFMNAKREPKIYRIFMGPRDDPYIAVDWCEKFRKALRARCTDVIANRVPTAWSRCHNDAKDTLWERGSIATFMVFVRWNVQPSCIHKAIKDSLEGYMIDWQQEIGCYQAFGYEIDF